METDHTNLGYETSRRKLARLHEELAKRERALRETQIRSIHEVEELKRGQEMQIDEFSRRELTESQATLQELPAVLVVCSAATKACDLIHGTCLVRRETFLAVHVRQSIHHRYLVEDIHRILWLGQQRPPISELPFDKFPHLQRFHVGR